MEEYKKNGKVVALGKKMGRMFMLDVKVPEIKIAMFAKGYRVVADLDIWHKHVGHINVQRLKDMQSQELVRGFRAFKVAEMHKVCEACNLGKKLKASFSHDKHVSKSAMEIVHFFV